MRTTSSRRSFVIFLAVGVVAVISVLFAVVQDPSGQRLQGSQIRSANDSASGTPTASARKAVGSWGELSLGGADEVEHFDTLPELSRSTDEIVEGTVTSAVPGRSLQDGDPNADGQVYQFLELKVTADDIVADSARDEYDLEFGPFLQEELTSASWPATLVGDEGLFVLRRKGSANPMTGAPQVAEEFRLNKYRLVSSQGLLLNDGGEVYVPLADEPGFPQSLEGTDFDATVSRVEELAN